jgi:hypothetical protein
MVKRFVLRCEVSKSKKPSLLCCGNPWSGKAVHPGLFFCPSKPQILREYLQDRGICKPIDESHERGYLREKKKETIKKLYKPLHELPTGRDVKNLALALKALYGAMLCSKGWVTL